MKKVMLITYPFPPMGGSGVQRTVKFAKYLPEFGWEPVILTVQESLGEELDSSLLSDLPDTVQIHRTFSIEPHRLWERFQRSTQEECCSPTKRFSQPTARNGSAGQRLIRFGKDFIDSLLFIPDRKIGWLPFALFKAIEILRRENISAIFSTSDPFTDHVVGYCLKKLFGKPWVADFRDPWTNNVLYEKPFGCRKRVNQWLEKIILHTADKVVVVSEPMHNFFQQQYPEVDNGKVIVITNGYDPDDFDSINVQEREDKKFTITFVGRFSTPNSRTPFFFKAIQSLIKDSPELKEGIRAVFVGLFSQADQEFVANLGLQGIVEIVRYQPHKKSIEYMLNSDVLLLTLAEASGVETMYSGKLFEYLAAKKPILGVMPECPAAALIKQLETGVIVQPNDVSAIRQAILALYGRWLNGTLGSGASISLDRFERRNLTASLVRCLDDVATKGRRYCEDRFSFKEA